MKKCFTLFFLVLFTNPVFSQSKPLDIELIEVKCDEELEAHRLIERITKDTIIGSFRTIEFTTVKYCCLDLGLEATLEKNTVNFQITESGAECECICGYNFKVKLPLNEQKYTTNFSLDGRALIKKNNQYRLYKKKYFVFENDTTGYNDENGLRQGLIIFKRKADILKRYYKDNVFIKYELLDLNGKLLKTGTNQDELFEN